MGHGEAPLSAEMIVPRLTMSCHVTFYSVRAKNDVGQRVVDQEANVNMSFANMVSRFQDRQTLNISKRMFQQL